MVVAIESVFFVNLDQENGRQTQIASVFLARSLIYNFSLSTHHSSCGICR